MQYLRIFIAVVFIMIISNAACTQNDENSSVGKETATGTGDSTGISTETITAKEKPEKGDFDEKFKSLCKEIQGDKGSDEVLRLIKKYFGSCHSFVPGSGFAYISMTWNFDEGRLVFLPRGGPVFYPKEGGRKRLIETHNPLEENLLGNYEMYTKPDKKHGGCSWLGNVCLEKDGTYSYKESGQNYQIIEKYKNNFFMLYPSGKFTITYLSGNKTNTLLEKNKGKTQIVKLKFKPEQWLSGKEYFITSDYNAMRLDFASDGKMDFVLKK